MNRWITVPAKRREGGTAGTEDPKYFLYWTNEKLLNQLVYTFISDA
jgi:hypothetical protein